MDKISAILSPRAIVQIEKSRLSRWSALTKSLSFAPEIVFREIVTKLTKLLRRLFCVAVLHPSILTSRVLGGTVVEATEDDCPNGSRPQGGS